MQEIVSESKKEECELCLIRDDRVDDTERELQGRDSKPQPRHHMTWRMRRGNRSACLGNRGIKWGTQSVNLGLGRTTFVLMLALSTSSSS
jgi:hypothetical protein